MSDAAQAKLLRTLRTTYFGYFRSGQDLPLNPPSWSARMNSPSGLLTAILPCNDLDASERFYNRLGFARPDSQRPARGEPDTYRMLSNGKGGYLHLTDAVEGWLIPGRNPFGLYLYLENVDAAAREFQKLPEDKPWGMYEFAMSDPDETLVRVGWPTRLRAEAQ
jgi:catechol 2,3-dioxygenase-like lactoylglutathione lyase family enzyme